MPFFVAVSVAAVALVALVSRARSRARRLDVGAVSDEWIAEHRADHRFPTDSIGAG